MKLVGVPACAAVLLCGAASAFADGDVLVSVDKSKALRLEGDDLSNHVQVDRDAVTHEFVVRGRDGTTVNGAEIVRFPEAPGIVAVLGAGDDKLAMGGFRLRKGLSVDLGDGDDELSLLRVRVRLRASVRGGAGNDTIRFEGGCDFGRGIDAVTTDGDDLFRFADGVSRGPVRVVTGNGNDRVEIHRNGLTDAASLRIDTGTGDDSVDLLGNTVQAGGSILTSDGSDAVTIVTSRFRHDLLVNGGNDDDNVSVDRATFDERLLVKGGEGTNRVFFGAAVFTSGAAAGGSGHSGHFYWWFVIIHVY